MGFLKEIWANKWVKLVVFLTGVLILGYFLNRLSSILTALAISWVLAYICDPIVDFMEARRIPRTLGVAILAVLLVLGVTGVIVVLIPVVVNEFRDLSQSMPDYGALLTEKWVPALEQSLGIRLPTNDWEIRSFFEANRETVNELVVAIHSPVSNFLKNTLTSFMGFITGLLTLVVIPVAWFLLLRDIDRISAGVVELVPHRRRQLFVDFMREVDEIISNFLRGQFTVALILATLYSLGLWLIADVPLGLVIGLFAGVASIVPYLGLILGIIPALVMAFLQHQDIKHPLLVVLVFAVAQTLEGNVITPKVVGDKLGLHPVTVIFSLLIWAQLAGVFGMLIAIPVTAVMQVLILRWVKRYKEGDFYNRATD